MKKTLFLLTAILLAAALVGCAAPAPAPASAAPAADIGEDIAKAAALAHAEVAEAEAAFTKVKLDTDDGRRVYELEFTAGDTEYDYDIDAATAEVINYSAETLAAAPAAAQPAAKPAEAAEPAEAAKPAQTADIGEAKAKEIALKDAGVAEADAKYLKVKLDRDDGRLEYEVDFVSGETEYEYDIDAATGDILKRDRESIYD